MSDYYDKLGEILNEVLETGEIPVTETETTESAETIQEDTPVHKKEKVSENISQKVVEELLKKKTSPAHTGEVIKNADYIKEIRLPIEVINGLKLFELEHPYTERQLKQKYHQLLLKYHPDSTKSEMEDNTILLNLRKKQTENINQTYELLMAFINPDNPQ